jgi:hypothetical protein
MIFRSWKGWLSASAGVLVLAVSGMAETKYVSPAESRLKADVTFLADDAREGRGPGTKGIDAAADYIATVFKEAGLKPAPGAEGFFQPFTIQGEFQAGADSSLAFQGPEGKSIRVDGAGEFTPLARGGSGTLEDLPLVFAGYGITAKDEGENLDYDDYADLDVNGKAVLILRREPRQDAEDSPFAGKEASIYASLRHKATNADKHGAAAVIMVNDAFSTKDKGDDLLSPGDDGNGRGVPYFMVKRAVIDRLLADAGAPSLAELEAKIDADLKPHSQTLEGWKVTGKSDLKRGEIHVKNVVGVLEGEGSLADEAVVVGAHYDHLGFGGSGSMSPGSKDIHNGADDNASGTAMMLEMVRRLSHRAEPLPRRVVFMAFSAEERGLLGSKHYVEHPLFPIKDTVAMVNFDMVGRLNDAKELTLFGTGTSPGFDQLVLALATSQGLKPKLIEGTRAEFNASDHASFYKADVPVLFAFTGTHDQYHRPTDDSPLINAEGMARIANFGELVLLDIAQRPERPKFVKLVNPPSDPKVGSVNGASVYMGTQPAYGTDVKGVKLDGVTEGSPAEKAGLKKGDVLVKFDKTEIDDIEAFMEALSTHKPGDTIDVVVNRDGSDLTLKVTLGSRSRN